MATRIHTSFTSPTMTFDADPESPMSDTPGHGLNSKSRNARAQARHRAKRKAYIEQLEASVTTLTDTLNDLKQRGADDPASLRYMALEAENSQLRHENASLRQENDRFRDQLADAVRRSTPPKAPISPVDEYGVSRDTYKRRKRSADDPYLMASQTPGALRAEVTGTPMAHQMAAGAAHMSQPRFDTHHQHAAQQLPRVSADRVSNEAHLPHPFSQGPSQNEIHLRYALSSNPMPSTTFPPFVTQKVAEPAYNYSAEHGNLNPAQHARQNYHIGLANMPTETQHHRSSSGSSVEGSVTWSSAYPPESEDHQRYQQPQSRISPHSQSTLAHFPQDARTLYHAQATM